jgi:hypothetical protein
MEAMLVLMTELQSRGYTEETEFYKATMTSPDGEIKVIVNAKAGVHNVVLSKGHDKNSRVVEFSDIRTKADAEEILSFLI